MDKEVMYVRDIQSVVEGTYRVRPTTPIRLESEERRYSYNVWRVDALDELGAYLKAKKQLAEHGIDLRLDAERTYNRDTKENQHAE